MRRGNSKRRLADPYDITVSAKINSAQKRTLQMFVEKFGLLHEGEAFRIAIESYMAKLVDDANPEAPKDFTAVARPPALKISPLPREISPIPRQPARDQKSTRAGVSVSPALTSDAVASDDGMVMPSLNIAAIEDDDGPLTASSRNRARARYEEEPDRWPAN